MVEIQNNITKISADTNKSNIFTMEDYCRFTPRLLTGKTHLQIKLKHLRKVRIKTWVTGTLNQLFITDSYTEI